LHGVQVAQHGSGGGVRVRAITPASVAPVDAASTAPVLLSNSQ
jgi:hypothetical protein